MGRKTVSLEVNTSASTRHETFPKICRALAQFAYESKLGEILRGLSRKHAIFPHSCLSRVGKQTFFCFWERMRRSKHVDDKVMMAAFKKIYE